MTTPAERTRSLIYALELVQKLAGRAVLDPEEIRRQAVIVLRHYPDLEKIDELAHDVAQYCPFPSLEPWRE